MPTFVRILCFVFVDVLYRLDGNGTIMTSRKTNRILNVQLQVIDVLNFALFNVEQFNWKDVRDIQLKGMHIELEIN